MPTVRDWEDYVDMEEKYDIEESRKKVLHRKKSYNKQEWDKLESKLNKKGYKKNGYNKKKRVNRSST
tara:strand:+ start:100 stop:300 length:201 start_codon:yes stop_codon:yes gene_type:complete